MEPRNGKVGDLLASTGCWWIPPYQRRYEWDADQWQALASDIRRLVDVPAGAPGANHWFGIVMVAGSERKCAEATQTIGHRDLELIDGQQRVLTFRMWVQALLDAAAVEGLQLEVPGFADIVPQESDAIDLRGILQGKWWSMWKAGEGGGLFRAYTYFRYLLWLGDSALAGDEPLKLPKVTKKRGAELTNPLAFWLEEEEAGRLPDGVTRDASPALNLRALLTATFANALVLQLEHQPAIDEMPAELFSSLNGHRLELLQFDHVRNWLFSRIPDQREMARLYDQQWRPRERELAANKDVRVKGVDAADAFLYDFLIARGETAYQQVSRSRTSAHFARYVASDRCPHRGDPGRIAEADLLPALGAWIALKSRRSESETVRLPEDARKKLRRIEAISRGPALPLLLALTERYAAADLAEQELLVGFSYVERLLVRMFLAGRKFSPLRSQLMDVAGRLGRTWGISELGGALAALTPSDREVRTRWDLHRVDAGFEAAPPTVWLAVFQGVENAREGDLAKDLMEVSGSTKFTIEHIYPKANETWDRDLQAWGVDPTKMRVLLNHIGNLAVVPNRLNASLKNKPFSRKQEMMRGSRGQAVLSLNSEWIRGDTVRWTPTNIERRGNKLLRELLEYWP